jgi:hypothetical protein
MFPLQALFNVPPESAVTTMKCLDLQRLLVIIFRNTDSVSRAVKSDQEMHCHLAAVLSRIYIQIILTIL